MGPSSQLPVSTVSQVLRDAGSLDRRAVHAALRGNIISYLRGDYYYFRDNTGTILIEMDPEDMPRQPFYDKTPLMACGEDQAGCLEGGNFGRFGSRLHVCARSKYSPRVTDTSAVKALHLSN